MRPEVALDKEIKQRREAMKKRLEKLGENPIVEKAIENQEPEEDLYEDFEIVHELVSAAFATYSEKKNLKKCMKELGESIVKASQQLGSKSSNNN